MFPAPRLFTPHKTTFLDRLQRTPPKTTTSVALVPRPRRALLGSAPSQTHPLLSPEQRVEQQNGETNIVDKEKDAVQRPFAVAPAHTLLSSSSLLILCCRLAARVPAAGQCLSSPTALLHVWPFRLNTQPRPNPLPFWTVGTRHTLDDPPPRGHRFLPYIPSKAPPAKTTFTGTSCIFHTTGDVQDFLLF